MKTRVHYAIEHCTYMFIIRPKPHFCTIKEAFYEDMTRMMCIERKMRGGWLPSISEWELLRQDVHQNPPGSFNTQISFQKWVTMQLVMVDRLEVKEICTG